MPFRTASNASTTTKELRISERPSRFSNRLHPEQPAKKDGAEQAPSEDQPEEVNRNFIPEAVCYCPSCEELGFDHFMMKPVSLIQLQSLIDEASERFLMSATV